MESIERRVGLLFPESYSAHDIMRGVRAYAQARRPWLFNRHSMRLSYVEDFVRWRADGLIVHASREDFFEPLQRTGLPIVNVSARLEAAPFPRVIPDDHAIGEAAADHLLDLGLADLATIGTRSEMFSADRLAGFERRIDQSAARIVGHHAYDRVHAQGWPTGSDEAERLLDAWLASLPMPVGVFCVSDDFAMYVLTACLRLGRRVPDDVAILGVNDDELVAGLAPVPLSSVRLPGELHGYRAAELLDGLMRGEAWPAEPIRLPPRGVVARASTDMHAVADPYLSHALRVIRLHACQGIDVRDVVGQVGLSRRALEIRARDQLGRTLGEEIRRVRIEAACRMLSETDEPISAVAEACGFRDANFFSRVFRKSMDMTATAYRRQFALR